MSSDGSDEPTGPTAPGERDRPDLDVDAMFAQIVAGWSTSPARTAPAGDDSASSPTQPSGADPEESDEASHPSQESEASPAAPARIDALGSPSPLAWLAQEAEAEAEIDRAVDGEGFVPPEPEPLPAGDLTWWLAWVGALGGPVYLVLAAVLRLEVSSWLLFFSVAAFIAGFATLIARMPDDRDEDDDGAVV
jgi:hypothetical protein